MPGQTRFKQFLVEGSALNIKPNYPTAVAVSVGDADAYLLVVNELVGELPGLLIKVLSTLGAVHKSQPDALQTPVCKSYLKRIAIRDAHDGAC